MDGRNPPLSAECNIMPTHLKRRLIAAATALVLLAVPSIWVARLYRQVNLDHALIAAIKDSDASKVDKLLAAGADPNTRDTPEKKRPLLQFLKDMLHPPPLDLSPTALIVTLDQRHNLNTPRQHAPEIVRSLLSRGANVNSPEKEGYTPLNALFWPWEGGNVDSPSVTKANMELLKILLAADADREERLVGATPLMAATMHNEPGRLQILLDSGANIEATTSNGETPLMIACHLRRSTIVRRLLDSGADPNHHPVDFSTSPLNIAQSNRNADIVDALKSHGARE